MLISKSEHIIIHKNSLDSKNRKTDVFDVYNKDYKNHMGVIKWKTEWRQYCFYPRSNTVFSKDCLEDINVFIKTLMDKRKQ